MNAQNTTRKSGLATRISIVLCLCLIVMSGVGFRFAAPPVAIPEPAPQARAAQLFAPHTAVYMGLRLDFTSLEGFANLDAIYFSNPLIKKAIQDLKANFNKETGLNFDRDVMPWLGTEAAMALPSAKSMDSPSGPDVILAIAAKDMKAAETFLEKLRVISVKSGGKSFSKQQYGGVTYWAQPGSTFSKGTYVAIFNQFLVLTNSEQALMDAVDRTKPGSDSLATNPNFQDMMKALPADAFMSVYLDAQVMGWASQMAEMPEFDTQPMMADLAAYQSIGMAMTFRADGLQVDGAIRYDPDKLSETSRAALDRPPSPNEVLQRIPAGALFFVAANDLSGMWQPTRAAFDKDPNMAKALRDMEKKTKISLDRDVFGWMTGELAMVMTKAQPADAFSPPLGGYLLIGTDSIKQARASVQKLLKQLGAGIPIGFLPKSVAGHDMQVVADISGKVMGGYGFWDNYFIAGYTEDALKAAFGAAKRPITGDPYFQAVAARLPDPNYGYFYLNIEQLRDVLEMMLLGIAGADSREYAEVKPFLEPIKAMGIASKLGPEPGQAGVRMFILITPE